MEPKSISERAGYHKEIFLASCLTICAKETFFLHKAPNLGYFDIATERGPTLSANIKVLLLLNINTDFLLKVENHAGGEHGGGAVVHFSITEEV